MVAGPEGESGVIVNQDGRTVTRSIVGENPKEGLRKVMLGFQVLWARIPFNVSTSKERPTALVRRSLRGEGLRT